MFWRSCIATSPASDSTTTSRRQPWPCWCRSLSAPRSSHRYGRPSRPSEGRSWRRSNMNKHSVTAQVQQTSLAAAVVAAVLLIPAPFVAAAADEARAIVEEAQKRTTSKSERYEGLLKTVDAGGKITEKSW